MDLHDGLREANERFYLFRKTLDGWRLIHHHASSAPVRVTEPFSGIVQ